ncbi:carbon-nitrogen hydrolase [Clavulina sp. PMI_390]|nr:carbon-nitrogen hydrolase [Clavulina sp. PMI_390]
MATRNSRLVKIAAVQDAPVAFSLSESISKFESLLHTATSSPHNADVVVFPEAFLCCYPRGYDFGAIIGSRTPEGRDWFRKYHDSAVDLSDLRPDSPWQRVLSSIRECNKAVVVLGVIEKEGQTGTIYCTALTIGSDGNVLAKHRKLMPTASERVVWGQGDGSGIQVAQTDFGKIGAVICWENYMPLLRYSMYSMGVEIYCAPTADGRETWASTIRHIAAEGRCFVISVNQFAKRSDYPADYPPFLNTPADEIVTGGGSMIAGPLGEILAGPLFNEAGILCVEVDLDDIQRAKLDFDPVGHYARPVSSDNALAFGPCNQQI